jgi:hypothetical protein
MAAKLTRLTHRIAIQMHLVAESCTICNSRSRRPVRKLLDTPSHINMKHIKEAAFYHRNNSTGQLDKNTGLNKILNALLNHCQMKKASKFRMSRHTGRGTRSVYVSEKENGQYSSRCKCPGQLDQHDGKRTMHYATLLA